MMRYASNGYLMDDIEPVINRNIPGGWKAYDYKFANRRCVS